MIALAIAALAFAATALGGFIFVVTKLVKRDEQRIDDVRQTADTAISLAATEAELERVNGALNSSLQRERDAHDMATHLAEEVRDALSKPTAAVGAGLAPTDVAGRLLRFYDSYAARRTASQDDHDRRANPILHSGDEALAPGGSPTVGSGTTR